MNSDIDKKVLMILLSGGHSVTEAFYKKVELQVEEVLPAVVPEVSYTLEELCGQEFWGQLSPNEQKLAGRCMARMVKNGELPFEFVGCKHASPKRYKWKE
jgi:hypothetical protein